MTAAILIGVLVVLWLGHSFAYPWKGCWKCAGNPKNSSSSGKTFNISCIACDSTGRRRRLGSKLIRAGFGKL